MSTPKPKFTWDQIDSLRKSAGLVDDDIPAGAVTVYDYAKQYNLGREAARVQLEIFVARGMFATGKKRALTRGGAPAQMRFYWPI